MLPLPPHLIDFTGYHDCKQRWNVNISTLSKFYTCINYYEFQFNSSTIFVVHSRHTLVLTPQTKTFALIGQTEYIMGSMKYPAKSIRRGGEDTSFVPVCALPKLLSPKAFFLFLDQARVVWFPQGTAGPLAAFHSPFPRIPLDQQAVITAVVRCPHRR